MGLILAVFVFIGTLLWCFVLIAANGSMAAPSMTGYDIKVPFFTGLTISVLLAVSHFINIGW